MADYLKGTVTEAYIRCMNQNAGVYVSPTLKVCSIMYDSGGAELRLYDKDGAFETTIESEIASYYSAGSWSGLTDDQKNSFVFINPGDTVTATNPEGTAITIEPWEELTELSPDLAIGWEEFDAVGTPVTQYIPIRKEFTISLTQKAIDGRWETVLFGDSAGTFAHHGIHDVGGVPTLTCFEGRNELGTDIGFQANIVMGKDINDYWVVMRAKNLCLHACTTEISPAAITSRTVEFSGNHGYFYVVPDDNGVPDVSQFHWALADGS